MNDQEILRVLRVFREELNTDAIVVSQYTPEQTCAAASRLRKILRTWETDNELILQMIRESAEESREIEVYGNWRTISEIQAMLNDFIALAQRNVPEVGSKA